MSERAREPLSFEDLEEEAKPEPTTGSAGGRGPPTAVGSGIGEGGGGREDPPGRGLGSASWEPGKGGEPIQIATGIGHGLIVPRQWYFAPIEDLNLSMRAYNCLRRSGLLTLGHVLVVREEQLLALRNFGRKSYDELRLKLDQMGILPFDGPDESDFAAVPIFPAE